jgi:sphinganine C4-monooxygenase
MKYNFSQPFFVHFDVLLGTRMTRPDIAARKQHRSVKTEKA